MYVSVGDSSGPQLPLRLPSKGVEQQHHIKVRVFKGNAAAPHEVILTATQKCFVSKDFTSI